MNKIHGWYCKSDRWKALMVGEVLPEVLGDLDLSGRVLEIGPGPGLVTQALVEYGVGALTTVEIDPVAADRLRDRYGDRVTVHTASAASIPVDGGSFDVAVCCTMLHHVPTAALQDEILTEMHRVLAPDGVLAGSDSKTSARFRLFHLFDTHNPVEPGSFDQRLSDAGFEEVSVLEYPGRFLFRARKAA